MGIDRLAAMLTRGARARACLALACLLVAMPAGAADMRLVVDNVAPFGFEENGQPKGVCYALLTELARRVGQDGAVKLVPLVRALETVQSDPNALSVIGRIAPREQHYTWIAKLFDEQVVLFSVADAAIDVSSLDKAKALRVGVIRGGPSDVLARELGFTRIDGASDAQSNARKLAMGRIDVWLAAWGVAAYGQQQAGLDLRRLHSGLVLQQFGMYLTGAAHLNKAEAERWRRALQEMKKDGSYARILAAYHYGVPAPD